MGDMFQGQCGWDMLHQSPLSGGWGGGQNTLHHINRFGDQYHAHCCIMVRLTIAPPTIVAVPQGVPNMLQYYAVSFPYAICNAPQCIPHPDRAKQMDQIDANTEVLFGEQIQNSKYGLSNALLTFLQT